jgi:hypothetical protein
MEPNCFGVVKPMTTTIFLVVAGLLTVVLLAYVVRGHVSSTTTLSRLHESTTHVDLAAFQNLIDPENERFLRGRLEAAQFRNLRRQRDRVVLAYLRCIATNAAVVMYVGEQSRSSSNEATRSAAERVVATALRLRINTLLTMVRLHFFLILPFDQGTQIHLAAEYPALVSSVMSLVMLQEPRATSLVISAL